MGDIFPFNLFLQKKMDICKDLDMQIFDDKKHDKIVVERGGVLFLGNVCK